MAARMESLGIHLRNRRKELGITQGQLAGDVGATVAYISMIENGHANPSIGLLKRIGDSLSLPVAAFFQMSSEQSAADQAGESGDQVDPLPRIVRPASRKMLTDPARGAIRWELLTPDLRGQLEFMLVTYAPYAGSDEFMSHTGEEAGLVLAGELEITFDDGRSLHLREGESIRFESSRPHRMRNPSAQEARVVWVVTPPSW